MLGLIWWPLLDQIDWDGALTHRVGKIHEVGLYNLKRQPDGVLLRSATPLVEQFSKYVASGEEHVGKLEMVAHPSAEAEDEQLPPIGEWIQPTVSMERVPAVAKDANGNGNGHAKTQATAARLRESAPAGLGGEPSAAKSAVEVSLHTGSTRDTDRY